MVDKMSKKSIMSQNNSSWQISLIWHKINLLLNHSRHYALSSTLISQSYWPKVGEITISASLAYISKRKIFTSIRN